MNPSGPPTSTRNAFPRRLRPTRRPALLLAALAFATLVMFTTLAVSTAAQASDTRDHERARAAVQAGEVLPLPALLERLQRSHPGQVLELELEREDGRWMYEVKLLHTNGQLLKLLLDARTGQLLQAKRKDDKTDNRKDDRSSERSRERDRDKDRERDRKPEPSGSSSR